MKKKPGATTWKCRPRGSPCGARLFISSARPRLARTQPKMLPPPSSYVHHIAHPARSHLYPRAQVWGGARPHAIPGRVIRGLPAPGPMAVRVSRPAAPSIRLCTMTARPICRRRRGRARRRRRGRSAADEAEAHAAADARRRRRPPPPSATFRRLPHSLLLSGSSEPPTHPSASSASLPCARRHYRNCRRRHFRKPSRRPEPQPPEVTPRDSVFVTVLTHVHCSVLTNVLC